MYNITIKTQLCLNKTELQSIKFILDQQKKKKKQMQKQTTISITLFKQQQCLAMALTPIGLCLIHKHNLMVK